MEEVGIWEEGTSRSQLILKGSHAMCRHPRSGLANEHVYSDVQGVSFSDSATSIDKKHLVWLDGERPPTLAAKMAKIERGTSD